VVENPFRIGERVSGQHFTDRADEVGRIVRAMLHPSRLLIYGPRRMGKSSAIEVASERVRGDGGLVVRADLGGVTSVSEVADRLLTSLARDGRWDAGRLREWLRALSLELTADPSGAPLLRMRIRPPAGDRLPGLRDVLDRLEREAADAERPVCVVLDEFQRLVDFGPERAAWDLRDIVQGHHHLSYICAGSEEGVIEALMARDGPFHGAFERLWMGPLPHEHFARWIDDCFRSSGIVVEPGIGDAAIDLAGPRTEDVLKLARQLWFRGAASARLEAGELDAAMDDIVRGDRGVFERLWDGLTPHQQNVLRAVAGGTPALTSAETRERYGLLSGSAVSQALDALVARGLVARTEGATTFDDPFFGAWVRSESPPGL
jgi:hypothetical protein